MVDQTGAAIPGATVNVYIPGGKEPVLSATTNEAGLFSFVAIRPDTYDVSVESKGFTKAMLRQVKVAPIQETGLAPIKLEVQSATTSVEVTADVHTGAADQRRDELHHHQPRRCRICRCSDAR